MNPVPVPAFSFLYSVAATGSRTLWAAGFSRNAANTLDNGLLMNWTGAVWKSVSSPLQGHDSRFWSITATQSGTVWVVGYSSDSSATVAASMAWNGKTWRDIPVSGITQSSVLYGVRPVPGGTLWAVGYSRAGALIIRWTGKTWVQVPNPQDDAAGWLFGVTATSAKNAWAVGQQGNGETLVLHWNGKTWS